MKDWRYTVARTLVSSAKSHSTSLRRQNLASFGIPSSDKLAVFEGHRLTFLETLALSP